MHKLRSYGSAPMTAFVRQLINAVLACLLTYKLPIYLHWWSNDVSDTTVTNRSTSCEL